MRHSVDRLVAVTALLLSTCSFAPDYRRPSSPVPPSFKETGTWVEARPDTAITSEAWWKVYGDPQLDAFEDNVTTANQNLKAAIAIYDQARAAVGIARAAYFPSITADVGATRQRTSATVINTAPFKTTNDFTMGADLTYEVDLWGQVRNTVAANEDQAAATAADLAGVALSLHAELANDYFTLRGDDATIALLDATVKDDERALDLTRQRFKGGVTPEADVDQAETLLENAKTQATETRLQRAQLEHAIAILMGEAPADFNLAPSKLDALAPHPATGLPSVLLERRPDITAAEKRVEAANAEIGVARAAWFPAFDLSAMFGVESAGIGRWMTAPSEIWSLGPSLTAPLFEGGQISSLNDQARAAYEQSVANYRQTVLSAYGDVEDNLVALHRIEEEMKTQAAAQAAAERALAQANDLYKAGATTFLDVVVTQNTALQAQEATLTLTVRHLVASVQLMRALGGGWQQSALSQLPE